MGVVIYNIVLVLLIIPVTIRAYLSLKKGRFPLPYFQNNAVVNRIKLRKAIGVLSPVLFWAFHVLWLVLNVAIDAWMGVLATVVYMVASPVLYGQIKAARVGVVTEMLAPEATESERT